MPETTSTEAASIEVIAPQEMQAMDPAQHEALPQPPAQPETPPPNTAPSFDLSQTVHIPPPEMPSADHAHPSASSAGDLPFYSVDASGHQHAAHGQPLNTLKMDSIGATLGLPGVGDFISKLDALGGYNAGQSEDQKLAGAYLAMNTAAKFAVMPPGNFADENQAGDVYAQLKMAALAGDVGTLRAVLAQHGGDARGLNDQQLIDLWGANEHHNLHAVLFGNPDIYNAVHATSLNDDDESGVGHLRGGYNDKGQWPQWGWFDAAKTFNEKFVS